MSGERRARVFGIGLEAYWEQFDRLEVRLRGYQRSVEERIGQWATDYENTDTGEWLANCSAAQVGL